MQKFNDNTLMPWGKYKGEKLANVPASHFLWLWDQAWFKGPLKEYVRENFETLKMEAKNEKK